MNTILAGGEVAAFIGAAAGFAAGIEGGRREVISASRIAAPTAAAMASESSIAAAMGADERTPSGTAATFHRYPSLRHLPPRGGWVSSRRGAA